MSLMRFVALAGVFLLAVSLCGCGDTDDKTKSPTKTNENGPTKKTNNEKKTDNKTKAHILSHLFRHPQTGLGEGAG